MRRRNRDRAAVDQQIAAEQHRRARLVIADVIGRVPRRVNHPQRAVASAHDRFVRQRVERLAGAGVVFSRQLREDERRPAPPQRREPRDMIGVRVRDQHPLQMRAGLFRFQRFRHALGVLVAVFARIDERRLLARQQPRVDAAARQRSRIVASDTDPSHRVFFRNTSSASHTRNRACANRDSVSVPAKGWNWTGASPGKRKEGISNGYCGKRLRSASTTRRAQNNMKARQPIALMVIAQPV